MSNEEALEIITNALQCSGTDITVEQDMALTICKKALENQNKPKDMTKVYRVYAEGTDSFGVDYDDTIGIATTEEKAMAMIKYAYEHPCGCHSGATFGYDEYKLNVYDDYMKI